MHCVLLRDRLAPERTRLRSMRAVDVNSPRLTSLITLHPRAPPRTNCLLAPRNALQIVRNGVERCLMIPLGDASQDQQTRPARRARSDCGLARIRNAHMNLQCNANANVAGPARAIPFRASSLTVHLFSASLHLRGRFVLQRPTLISPCRATFVPCGRRSLARNARPRSEAITRVAAASLHFAFLSFAFAVPPPRGCLASRPVARRY